MEQKANSKTINFKELRELKELEKLSNQLDQESQNIFKNLSIEEKRKVIQKFARADKRINRKKKLFFYEAEEFFKNWSFEESFIFIVDYFNKQLLERIVVENKFLQLDPEDITTLYKEIYDSLLSYLYKNKSY